MLVDFTFRPIDTQDLSADVATQLAQVWKVINCPEPGCELAAVNRYVRSSRVVVAGWRSNTIVAWGRIRVLGDDDARCVLAVHPDYQQLGVGSMLLEQLLERGRESGLKRLQLEYWERTPEVERLSERLNMPLVVWSS